MLCDLMFNAKLAQLVNTLTYLKGITINTVITNDDLRIFDLLVLPQNHQSSSPSLIIFQIFKYSLQ